MYKRILVATDGSNLSKKAVKAAIELAGTCQAELVAVRVIPRYVQTYFEGSMPLDPKAVSQIEDQWKNEAEKSLATVLKAASSAHVPTKTQVVKGQSVADALIQTAKKSKCDLIVMASHGRKGLSKLLLGSETQHVLTHAQIPVLVLR